MKKRFSVMLGAVSLVFSIAAYSQSSVDVFEASISALQTALTEGEITSVELVGQYLNRIRAYDEAGPQLNSIIRLNEKALEIAAQLDEERRQSGPRSLLHGIPIVVKDNYNTAGLATTGGSVALANFLPNDSATQVKKLRSAGAIIIAKTNLHEYAYGITSISSIIGQTRNPYDIRRVPGGSSGGTAAAVAASFAAIGLGSDTCGSIRIPAAFNNLVGLRPTKGLSSIYGIMPLSHTQDVAGPLARSLEDLAITLDIVVGFDPQDEATHELEQPLTSFQDSLTSIDLSSVRLGRLASYMDRADSATRGKIDEALRWYESQGAEIVDIEIPELGKLVAASGVIGHEFETDLNQYLNQFGSDQIESLDQIVALGLHHESISGVLTRSSENRFDAAAYATALAGRGTLRDAIEESFDAYDLDAIVYPPIAQLPVFIGDPQPGNNCSVSANSGLPALSMAVGFSDSGLPIGMELLGRSYEDHSLIALAYPFEEAINPRESPPVTPALVSGEAPSSRKYTVNARQPGIVLTVELEWVATSNSLFYSVVVEESGMADVYALTLAAASAQTQQSNEAVEANLLGPDQTDSRGEIFLNPKLRQALENGNVYLKIFSSESGRSGTPLAIQ